MSEATPYTRASLPVEGGFLEYGQWGSATAPPIIALHGVTSTHMDWVTFGETANDRLRVIAPDLRGRGRSSDIDGPWGMPAHARDVVALMDAMGIERGVLVGHSMGGFVAVQTAVLFPDRVSAIVLVDGGLPAVEANAGGDALTRIVLDAARERLEQRFDSPAAYLRQLAAQLPEGQSLTPEAEQIARYDLVSTTDGEWRVAGSFDAIAEDSVHITGDASDRTLRELATPAILIRAGRGLPPREEGLYSPAEVATWTDRVDALDSVDLPDADHGSIIRDPRCVETLVTHAERMIGKVTSIGD